MFLRKTFYALMSPPSIFFVGLLLVVIFYHRGFSRKLLLLITLAFFSLSTPFVADRIHQTIDVYPALNDSDIANTDAQAIVLLSGGIYGYAQEYERNMPNANSMQRALYAARLHRQTGLPILISGGGKREGSPVGSALIQNFMQIDLNTPVRWIETSSQTTLENAKYSQALLANFNINKIILVTENFHMKRSVEVFKKVGMQVTPAPTMKSKQSYYFSWLDKIAPTANDFKRSMTGLHEILGSIWYQIEDSKRFKNLSKKASIEVTP